MYAVVTFKDSDTVALVPAEWLVDDSKESYCWWPPYRCDATIQKAARNREPVGDDWTKYSAKVYYKHGISLLSIIIFIHFLKILTKRTCLILILRDFIFEIQKTLEVLEWKPIEKMISISWHKFLHRVITCDYMCKCTFGF